MSSFYQTFQLQFPNYDSLSLNKAGSSLQKPELKKIILSFSTKETNYKKLAYLSFTLKLVTGLKSRILTAKSSNVNLKIRKGSPVGCQVILRKSESKKFFLKNLCLVFPNLKRFEKLKTSNKIQQSNSLSFFIENLLLFPELENKYELFQKQKLPKLNITLITIAKNSQELQNILTSLGYPTKIT